MPVRLPNGLKRLSEKQFARAAYTVMETVFAVHNDLGRMFDEDIYSNEIARRLSGTRVHVPFEIYYETFRKLYVLDLLYADVTVFELKAAEATIDRFRAQLLNYLLMLDLPRGKLVNMRTESVEHEFVNAPISREERTSFAVSLNGFKNCSDSCQVLPDLFVHILRDWGTCLETNLYEEVLTHFLGGDAKVIRPVDVLSNGKPIGRQSFRLLADGNAFKITGFEGERPQYEAELHRVLSHTALRHIQWVNVGRRVVTFKTITK